MAEDEESGFRQDVTAVPRDDSTILSAQADARHRVRGVRPAWPLPGGRAHGAARRREAHRLAGDARRLPEGSVACTSGATWYEGL